MAVRVVLQRRRIEPTLRWHTTGGTVRPLHVAVKDSVLTIQSASPEAWRKTTLPLDGHDYVDGDARFVAARVLAQMKASSRSDSLTLESDGGVVSAWLGHSRATIPTMADIPGFWAPVEPVRSHAEVNADDLAWAIKAAANAAAPRRHKAAEMLKAIRVCVDANTMQVSGTDSYRLAQAALTCRGLDSPVDKLVHPDALVSATAIMDDPVHVVTSGDHHLGLSDNTHTLLTASLAEQGADVSAALNHATQVDQHAATTSDDLRRALAAIGSPHLGQVELTFGRGTLQVANRTGGEPEDRTEVSLSADIDGLEGRTVTVNAASLACLCAAVRTKGVDLGVNSTRHNCPLVVREDAPRRDTQYLGALAMVQR